MNPSVRLREEAREQQKIAQLVREEARIARSISGDERRRLEVVRRLQNEMSRLQRLRMIH